MFPLQIQSKQEFERNLNFRRIRSSMDTNTYFAYDYVALGNVYLDLKLSRNKMWG